MNTHTITLEKALKVELVGETSAEPVALSL